ncbi:hypothetical protein TNCV_1933831 [Trichonephila clavipes]|nr:hypothetical protein TNCV_1933831 [Trichonephila clavipes]
MLLVPRKNNVANNVPLLHFLIDFNAIFATCTNSTMTDFGYWQCSTFSEVLGAFYRLEDMNLLNRKELLSSEEESLPALTCGLSEKLSASSKP